MKERLKEPAAIHAYARSTGATSGFHAEDEIEEDQAYPSVPAYRSRLAKKDDTLSIPEEDNIYNTRPPSSVVRRYQIPPTPAQNRTVMRVTRHAGPPPMTPRASLKAQQPQANQQAKQSPQKQQKHWLFYAGGGMLAAVALWAIGSTVVSFAQAEHDNLTYGTPRTFQADANVGHQGTSHFIVENLHGDIVVIEVHPSNLAQTKIYQGPQFSGQGTDLQPATLSFEDVNADGKPDMIISVGNGRYLLINTGSAFRPTTLADRINQEVK